MRRALSLLCILLIALSSYGCSKGSSSKNPSPDQTSETPETPVDVTLAGRVTDKPVPGAEVCAFVGTEKVRCANTDQDGNYSLALEQLPEGAAAVRLVARKASDRGDVVLTSNLGFAGALPEGDALDMESLPGLAVTNLTTAREILAREGEEINLHRMYTLDHDQAQGEAAELLSVVIKDVVDELLDAGTFALEGVDSYQVAEQVSALMLAAARENPGAELKDLARAARDEVLRGLNLAYGQVTNQGNALKDSEAYQLSQRPHINGTSWLGRAEDSGARALLTFTQNAVPSLWINGGKDTSVGAERAQARWDQSGRVWSVELAQNVVLTGDRARLEYRHGKTYVFEPLAPFSPDELAGWYFLEKRERQSGSQYGAWLFGEDGAFVRYDEAFTHVTANDWNWWHLSLPEDLVATETGQSWALQRGVLQIGDARFYRMPNDAQGSWRFLQQKDDQLSVLEVLPWQRKPDGQATSFYDQLKQLAASPSGYATLSTYPEQRYFGWTVSSYADGQLTRCAFFPGDSYSIDHPECGERVEPLASVGNAFTSRFNDEYVTEDEVFSFYHVAGSLNGRFQVIEDKVRCGEGVCDWEEDQRVAEKYYDGDEGHRAGYPTRDVVLESYYRTFNWDPSVISGATLRLATLNNGQVEPFSIRFNSGLSAGSKSGLVAEVVANGVSIIQPAAMFANHLDDQLGTGFIRIDLAAETNLLGQEGVKHLYVFLHSRDPSNPRVSILPLRQEAEDEWLYLENPSAVDAAATLRRPWRGCG